MKYELTEFDVAEFNRLRAKIDGLRVMGMSGYNSPTDIVIGPPPNPPQGNPSRAPAALPKGQYQYMAYITVSQNQSGFDFIRAHPLI